MTSAKARLIKARDNLLDRISGVPSNHVLNPYAGEIPSDRVTEPAAELKKALDMMKVEAMEAGGAAVNYILLRNSPAYNDYRKVCSPKLRGFDPGSFSTRQEKIAFWINLYNALVLDAVIYFGVQRSVTEGRLGVLAFFRRAAYNVGGYRVSADDIEHGILRSNKGHPYLPGAHFSQDDQCQKWAISPLDVRIHFALNCASRSCPPIQAYAAEQLDSQLNLAASNFVYNHVQINADQKIMTTSAIFRWYQGDFGGRKGVLKFIANHLPQGERREWLLDNQRNVRLRYEPYDWGLNVFDHTTSNAVGSNKKNATDSKNRLGDRVVNDVLQ
jgi:hypothetical protein